MGEGGGKDERGAVDGENDRWFEEAGYVFGVGGAERRGGCGLDGGQADDDDRLGVVEGRRGIEAKVEAFVFGEGYGGNVLVLGGVQTAMMRPRSTIAPT